MGRMLLLILGAVLSAGAWASEKPTVSEVNKVMNYYYEGTGNPILREIKLCADIEKQGETKNECTEAISEVGVGQQAFVWMNFFGPQNKEYKGIIVQFNRKGLTMVTRTLDITGSLRYRAWKRFKPAKAGNWEAKVLVETDAGYEEMGKISFNVTAEATAEASSAMNN